MATLEEAVQRQMQSGGTENCNVDGHDFKLERIGRKRVPGSNPKVISVDGKIVHEYSFPQSDDDITFKMTITGNERATIETVDVKGGLWSFDDFTNALRGLPGLIATGPLPVIVLNVALPAGNSWQAAMVKVLQAIGKEVYAEYF